MDELYDLIDALIDEDECSFDHHGHCQAHSYFGEPGQCPHNKAKKVLEQRQESGHVGTIVSGQNYTKVWELLKEARDEADAEGLGRVSSGIEVLLELINHRCTKHR